MRIPDSIEEVDHTDTETEEEINEEFEQTAKFTETKLRKPGSIEKEDNTDNETEEEKYTNEKADDIDNSKSKQARKKAKKV